MRLIGARYPTARTVLIYPRSSAPRRAGAQTTPPIVLDLPPDGAAARRARSLGQGLAGRSIRLYCGNAVWCPHEAEIDGDFLPDERQLILLKQRFVCNKDW
jgi:hypothetical protein